MMGWHPPSSYSHAPMVEALHDASDLLRWDKDRVRLLNELKGDENSLNDLLFHLRGVLHGVAEDWIAVYTIRQTHADITQPRGNVEEGAHAIAVLLKNLRGRAVARESREAGSE